jgi:chemotaxis protein MotB
LSDSLVTAFDARSRTLDPVSVGDNLMSGDTREQALIELPVPGDFPADDNYRYSIDGLLEDVPPRQPASAGSAAGTSGGADKTQGPGGGTLTPEARAWQQLSTEVEGALGGLLAQGEARIVDKGEWLEVNIQSSVLFGVGQAEMAADARTLLAPVAALLAGEGRQVQVEGHTDNLPIETEQFPSNWELSSARAASVVRWFITQGIDGEGLSAIGYGEYRPMADNGTDEGRRANRRIAILVSRETDADAAGTETAGQTAMGDGTAGSSSAPAAATDAGEAGNAGNLGSLPPANAGLAAVTPRRLVDFRLTNAELSRPLPKGAPPVPLRFERISLDQARERWQIQRSSEGGTR